MNTKNSQSCCGGDAATKPASTCCGDKPKAPNKVSCCGGQSKPVVSERKFDAGYVNDWIKTKSGDVPRVSTRLNNSDRWGNLKVRLALNRMKHLIEPGVYAVGTPDEASEVLVTANYKLTFDVLRKELGGIDAWLLVLDTKGINVWCAAGKGTFGTDELVHRIEASGLNEIVTHRRLIVPQLGGVGVSAHDVRKHSGFTVTYGPVRAEDIPAFLKAGRKATPEMRRVSFSIVDRLKVIPVEVVQGAKLLLIAAAAFLLLSGLHSGGYSFRLAETLSVVLNIFLAYAAGAFFGPLLLPWLPGRSFSLKGAVTGTVVFVASFLLNTTGTHVVQVAAWFLMMAALSSFLTMNFTGASTFTSLSGVKKEMKTAVPIQLTAAVIGIGLWITGRFI